MRSLGHLLSFGGGRTATLIVFAVAAGSIPLRADMVCMGDCEQPTSHFSGISGIEDLEAAISGFDVFFKPGVPIFVIAPPNTASQLDSSTNSASGAWTDAGPLFSSGSDDPSGSPSESNSSSSGSQRSGDQSIVTLVNQLINSPAADIGSSSTDPPDTPAPTPEPRYFALALLGLGWTGLVAFRKFKTPRAVQRES